MTQTDFDRMWAEQDGCCAVCGRALDDTKFTNTHVDHDHVTGVVRAILCRKCNLAMAVVDDATWLAKLVAYRDRHAAKRPPTQCECDEAPKHAEFCPARKAKAVQP